VYSTPLSLRKAFSFRPVDLSTIDFYSRNRVNTFSASEHTPGLVINECHKIFGSTQRFFVIFSTNTAVNEIKWLFSSLAFTDWKSASVVLAVYT